MVKKNGCWSTAFRREHHGQINNKPAGSLEGGDKPSETELSRKGFLVGEVKAVSFANKQQANVYKMAQKPTPQNKFWKMSGGGLSRQGERRRKSHAHYHRRFINDPPRS